MNLVIPSEGKVIRIHPPGNMNISPKNNGNPSNSYKYVLLKATNANLQVEIE